MPDEGDVELAALVAEQLEQDGTFLDGSCANGALMETVQSLAARRGVRIEPYGTDVVPEIAELARRRLPRWADRIWTADLLDWVPPRRFDTVRIGPEPSEALVRRAPGAIVAPGGTLLIGPYAEEAGTPGTAGQIRGWGFEVRRMVEIPQPGTRTVHRLLLLPALAAEATVTSLDERRRRRSG